MLIWIQQQLRAGKNSLEEKYSKNNFSEFPLCIAYKQNQKKQLEKKKLLFTQISVLK